MSQEKQTDILNDFDEELIDRSWIKKLLILEIVTLFLILLLRESSYFLPTCLYVLGDTKIYTFGTLVLIIYIANAIQIPRILNRALPKLSILIIDLICLSNLFFITVTFKLINFALYGYRVYDLDLLGLLIASFGIAFFCMLITNIRIFKLRGRNTLFPVISLLLALVLLGFLANR